LTHFANGVRRANATLSRATRRAQQDEQGAAEYGRLALRRWSIHTDMAPILLETSAGCRPGHARNHAVRPQIETSTVRGCLLLEGDKHALEE